MLGIVLLQQMEDLTDEETVRQFSFNLMWHYALNVTDSSDFSCLCLPPHPLDHARPYRQAGHGAGAV